MLACLQLLYCKWDMQARVGVPLAEVAARVVEAMQAAQQLPAPSLVYNGREVTDEEPNDPDHDPRDPVQLRVLIESRHGPVRNIKNMQVGPAAAGTCVYLGEGGEWVRVQAKGVGRG